MHGRLAREQEREREGYTYLYQHWLRNVVDTWYERKTDGEHAPLSRMETAALKTNAAAADDAVAVAAVVAAASYAWVGAEGQIDETEKVAIADEKATVTEIQEGNDKQELASCRMDALMLVVVAAA